MRELPSFGRWNGRRKKYIQDTRVDRWWDDLHSPRTSLTLVLAGLALRVPGESEVSTATLIGAYPFQSVELSFR